MAVVDRAPLSKRRRSIRWQLAALVAIAIGPVVLALSLVLGQLHYSESARQRSELLSTTRRLADVIEREVDGYVAALQGLATSGAMKRGDWAAVDEQARVLAKHRGSAIAVRSLDGQQLVNTSVAPGAPLPISTDPVLIEADRRAIETRLPVVSDLYIGTVTRRAIVLAVVPAPLEGAPAYLLNLAVLPERLAELLARSAPQGWTATVLDRRNRIIARSSETADYVGRSATPEQIEQLSRPDGTWVGHRIDGTPMLAAHASLASGWKVSIGVPLALLSVPSQRAWAMLLATAVFAALLSIGLSYQASRRLQGEILLLTSPEARLAHSESITLDELYRLAQDLNQRDRALIEQLHAQAHLASIVRSSNDAIFTTSIDGTIISWNKGAEELFGYTASEMIGSNGVRLVPEDRRYEIDEEARQVANDKPHRLETIRRRKDGTLIDVAVNAAPLSQGDATAISIVAFEITERKRTERQRDLLLRELDHRLKNVFATISSLIGLSARSARDIPGYAKALRQRLYALSAVHNLVRGSGLEDTTSLGAIAHTVAEGGFSRGQITADGANVRLSASAAIALGMIFNELLTNALKYGALSSASGRVRIGWDLDDELRLTWSETGGPSPTGEAKPGFGTLMIEQNARSIGGSVATEWLPDGMVVRLRCPRAALNDVRALT